jgi:hypothetical protein
MADSSLMPALIGLGGTVIGFAGGFVAQWFLEGKRQAYETQKQMKQQEYEKEKETRRKKAEKLEELASTLYDHQHWLIQLTNKVLEGERMLASLVAKLPPAPFSKLEAISIVYFSGFQEPIKELSKASAIYVNFITRDGQQNLVQGKQLLSKHNELVNRLEDLIRDYAEREFQ